jgi:hypothetical protein
MLNVAVTEVSLDRSGIMSLVGQGITAGMPIPSVLRVHAESDIRYTQGRKESSRELYQRAKNTIALGNPLEGVRVLEEIKKFPALQLNFVDWYKSVSRQSSTSGSTFYRRIRVLIHRVVCRCSNLSSAGTKNPSGHRHKCLGFKLVVAVCAGPKIENKPLLVKVF